MKETAALLLLDLQNDFCAGGPLAVPDADAIIPLANQLQKHFELVVAANDWHPHDHISFAANHPGYEVGDVLELDNTHQILWKTHGVQHTQGAAFHPGLETLQIKKVFFKGCERDIDSYSAFYDAANLRCTGLGDYLARHGIREVYILGVATEYCVKYSCFDALRLGFKVYVIQDACRGVREDDVKVALRAMKKEGGQIVRSRSIFMLQ